MQTRIVLVRHGETKWNSEGIFRGRSDIPLNARGIKQAEATGSFLQSFDFAAVYSSPLSRTLQTAAAICLSRKIKPQPLDAFTDISFGPWEGQAYSSIEALYPDEIRIWKEKPAKHKLTGAETLDEAKLRAFTEMELLAQANRGKNIAIVSHRVIIKLLLLASIGLGSEAFWKIKQDPCCINILVYRQMNEFIIVRLNETCHLQTLDQSFRQIDF